MCSSYTVGGNGQTSNYSYITDKQLAQQTVVTERKSKLDVCVPRKGSTSFAYHVILRVKHFNMMTWNKTLLIAGVRRNGETLVTPRVIFF